MKDSRGKVNEFADTNGFFIGCFNAFLMVVPFWLAVSYLCLNSF
ncbi:hypothetical protein ACQCWI_28415 [Bacillus thuringiensis]